MPVCEFFQLGGFSGVGLSCFSRRTLHDGRAVEAYNEGRRTDVTGIAPSDARILVRDGHGSVVTVVPDGNVYAASVGFVPAEVTVMRPRQAVHIRLYRR